MPPFLPRKRLRSPSPSAGPSKPPAKSKSKVVASTPRKPTLFDDLDARTGMKRSAEDQKVVLAKFAATDDESSLSSLSSEEEDEFEDIPGAKRQKIHDGEDEDDENEDIEFEDVDPYAMPELGDSPDGAPPTGDLELTLARDPRVSVTNPLGTKKGPSKIERRTRTATHQMHVQFLMFHNAIRNSWLCNKELQEILVKQLSPGVLQEIEKWRVKSGLQVKTEDKGKAKGKEKGKGKDAKGKKPDVRSSMDWSEPARRLDSGKVDMSAGDPLYKLLKTLMSYWKQRFRITAPGLRKLGYMPLERLNEETRSLDRGEHDLERHGERIRDVEEFKECARTMEGSRDVGAQLFTALLRGLGLETRLVANLQPVGFGWSQFEEASEKNPRMLKKPKLENHDSSADDDFCSSGEEKPVPPRRAPKGKAVWTVKSKKIEKQSTKSARSSLKESKNDHIDMSKSDEDVAESGDDSVVDVTPAKSSTRLSLPYDKDLVTPSYWSEVLSPVTNTYTPVDAVVLHIYASNTETIDKFLPPPKSEKVRHITSYVVGHSPDGTAKDVTTRYLKGHIWPGKTKGYRLPPEKIPIRNKHGKVKHYEHYDWFKVVMSGYVRGSKNCPRTEIDNHEEATDLKPVKREKKVVEDGKESLQYYKTSSEFVLERHLKREEALIPAAKHVKMFMVKGKGEASTEEKVFLRKDVVNCKSMETWHKEGRAPNPGEEPLKRVPYRAATTNRRRELAEAEQATGGKVLQGLFSREQTDWIIPPPIENGVIPKNNFGNIDLYVDSMLPEGSVHIPMRGTVKICKRLGIDYAEAVTGFEFGHRMAVPIITGVVVAEEHYDAMMEEWHKDEAERARKEDEKQRKLVLGMWRRMLMGMRIIERVREEYGDGGEEVDLLNPLANQKTKEKDKEAEAQRRMMSQRDEENAGGFFPEGHDEEEDVRQPASFFPVAHPEDEEEEGGGFIVEGEEDELGKEAPTQTYPTPQSLEPNGKSIAAQETDEEEENQQDDDKLIFEFSAPAPKKRGRPSGSTKKTSRAKPSPAANVKRLSTKKNIPVSRSSKQKTQIQDSEEDEEDEEDKVSELSELESEGVAPPPNIKKKGSVSKSTSKRKHQIADSDENEGDEISELESEDELPKKIQKRAPIPKRQTPKRNAARKAQTALKSRYFAHSDDDDDS